MLKKAKNLLTAEIAQDLAGKLFFAVSLIYLLLFSAESVMQGLVMDVLNINVLLLLILAGIGYFAWLENNGLRIEHKVEFKKFIGSMFVAFLLLTVAVALFIVQYKVSIPETIFYMVLAFILGRLFYKMIL